MSDFLINLVVIATMTVPVSEWITKKTHVSGKAAQIQAWLVAVLITVLANLLGIGTIGNMKFVGSVLFGAAAGLMANGVFDIAFVKKVLTWIGLRVNEAIQRLDS